jgi:hypothetical protein
MGTRIFYARTGRGDGGRQRRHVKRRRRVGFVGREEQRLRKEEEKGRKEKKI